MEKYLEHYGVEGMHWGIRRYQNKDGSLTKAGQKRYGTKSAMDAENRLKKNLKNMVTFKSYNIGKAAKNYAKEYVKATDARMAAKGSMFKRGAIAAGLVLGGKGLSMGAIAATPALIAAGSAGLAVATPILGAIGASTLVGLGIAKGISAGSDAAIKISKNRSKKDV